MKLITFAVLFVEVCLKFGHGAGFLPDYFFTHRVKIESHDEVACAGALITSDIIITSSRCVDYMLRVKLGHINLFSGKPPQKFVEEWKYTRFISNFTVLDGIAIAKLNDPIDTSQAYAFPVEVPAFDKRNDFVKLSASLRGNQPTDFYSEEVQRESNVTVLDNNECDLEKDNGLLCVRGVHYEFRCRGDSGEPIEFHDWKLQLRPTVFGILAVASDCSLTKPFTLINVGLYFKWIQENISLLN